MGGADNELQAAARTGNTHIKQILVSSSKRISGDLPPKKPLEMSRLAQVGKLSSTRTTNAKTICSRPVPTKVVFGHLPVPMVGLAFDRAGYRYGTNASSMPVSGQKRTSGIRWRDA